MVRQQFRVLFKSFIWLAASGALALTVILATGCAKQNFQAQPQDAASSTPTPPTPTPNGSRTISKIVGAGKVDILLVNDNSGSMAINQSRLSTAWGSFISRLGAGRDWRLAMTTTDVYATAGRLIPFNNGQPYISSSTLNAQSLLSAAVVRQETINCENSNFTNCPSDDERGIYAAYLALTGSEASTWLRSDAATIVIFLANEDERSDQSVYNSVPQYALQTYDQPSTLVGLFGGGGQYYGKIFQAHSIIVVPGDETCRLAQSKGTTVFDPKAFFGRKYNDLSNSTIGAGWGGSVSSICANDYSPITTQIATGVAGSDLQQQLPCTPKNGLVQVTLSPADGSVSASYDPSANVVSVSSNIKAGTTWSATFTCQ